MKKAVVLALCGSALFAVAATPKVIFDTDMITDFDDVGALACLHALADAGECEILATVSSTRGNASVGAIEVINHYYGRPDIPTGAPKGMGILGAHPGARKKVDPKAPLGEKSGNDGGHYKYCFAGCAVAEMKVERSPVKDVFAGNIPSRDEIRKDAHKWLRRAFGMGGRAAWDETAVLAAVRGIEPYFNAERGMFRMVGKKGGDEWVPDAENGPHIRLTEKVSKFEVARVIDGLMTRKPLRGATPPPAANGSNFSRLP